MPTIAKGYIYCVIAVGAAVMAASIPQWNSPHPAYWLTYLALAALGSLVQLRLPGMSGSYSLSFLCLLFGIAHLTLLETLIAGYLAAFVGSLRSANKNQKMTQVLFNTAELTISVGVCFLLTSKVPLLQGGQYRPGAMAAVVAAYFLVNTVLVSGVLSLLQNRSLAEVWEQWYVWPFPYYLVGAGLVGLTLTSRETLLSGTYLLLLPLIYLVHFLAGLSELQPSPGGAPPTAILPAGAKAYVVAVAAAGMAMLSWAAWNWECQDAVRLMAYLAVGAAASALKVRLPQIDGTISLNFVILLAALVELSFSEAVMVGAVVGVVQCVWKTKRRPLRLQVLFNSSCLACSVALAWLLGRWGVQTAGLDMTVVSLLTLATPLLYLSNTLMVSAVLSLAQTGALGAIWKNCCFWSLPYYLVGAVAAGLMELSARASGWQSSFLVFPLMGLLYVTYRIHVSRAVDVTLNLHPVPAHP